ncbi:MAG: ACP S-malonyltransferase [Rhodospirillales bacterium]|nr:ACP S-malonyltransferase [Rhodospirillales bacterium]
MSENEALSYARPHGVNTAAVVADRPTQRRALVFPGQGSQSVGMGRELAEQFSVARRVFQEVDDALGQHLSRLMIEGPEAELVLTENAQPALMAVSMATLAVLRSEYGIEASDLGQCVAGHSLGEYTALTAVGSFGLGEAARLLRIRGLAMQTAVPVGEGAMAAMMGLDLDTAHEIAAEATRDSYDGAVCVAANDNAPGQVVISGSRSAVVRAIEIAALRGSKRSIMLPVSGPFHCPLMAPVADVMAKALADVNIQPPSLPLISNVTASAVTNPAEIRSLLVRQITGMVRWRESVLFMKSIGVRELIEFGAGKVLSGLARRIDREVSGLSIGTPADITAFAATI